MGDRMLGPLVELDPDQAAAALRPWLGRTPEIVGLRRLTGGCCTNVFEVKPRGDEPAVVLKVSGETGDAGLADQYKVLRHIRDETRFPVPEPLFVDTSGASIPYAYLILERLPGVHLGEAHLDLSQREALERSMAEAVAELHSHTRSTFGRLA